MSLIPVVIINYACGDERATAIMSEVSDESDRTSYGFLHPSLPQPLARGRVRQTRMDDRMQPHLFVSVTYLLLIGFGLE